MTGAIDRALAELHRRRAQQRAAADGTADDRWGRHEEARHSGAALAYENAITVLSDTRPPDAVDASVPETGVTIDTDELVIVEVTDAGHRRRTYRAAPHTPGVDARLEVARWHADGWRVVGEEPVAQFAINGERAFDPAGDT